MTDVPFHFWDQVRSDQRFWNLVDEGIIEVRQPGPGKIVVLGRQYVGRAVFPGGTLEVVPKLADAVEALLSFATHSAFRIKKLPAPTSDLDRLVTFLAGQFIFLVRSYVTAGREWEYRQRKGIGSLQRGRLDLRGTISLRARGDPVRIAYNANEIVHTTDKNRIIYAGLRELEHIGRLVRLPEQITNNARALSALFVDCRDVEILFGQRSRLIELGDQLANQSSDQREKDMLSLAVALIGRAGLGGRQGLGRTVPRTWFISLQSLFERAVLQVAETTLPSGWTVRHGSTVSAPIFPQLSHKYTANPDLVFTHRTGIVVVGDVKYKELGGGPGSSDLYQLLTHAAAFGARTCFLVFPGTDYGGQNLGQSATGCTTRICEVRPKDLRGDMARLLHEVLPSIRIHERAADEAAKGGEDGGLHGT